jgi:kanamycin kinase
VTSPPRLVWENELGGVTFDAGDCYVKWTPAGNGIDLFAESERLTWAAEYVPVPLPRYVGRDDAGTPVTPSAGEALPVGPRL